MARPLVTAALAAVALLGSAACGSSGGRSPSARAGASKGAASGSTGATARPPLPAPGEGANTPSLLITSPLRTSVGGINLHYTCRGANVPPPLSWQGVSSTAKEVLVFVRTIGGGVKIQTDWALAGISPKVTALDPARLPKGTVVGRNSFGRIGYSLCPPAGSLVTLGVYAREQPLNLKRGFNQKGLLKYLQGPGVQWGGDTLSVRKSPGLASPSS